MLYHKFPVLFGVLILITLIRDSVQVPQLQFSHIGRNLTGIQYAPSSYSDSSYSDSSRFDENESESIALRVLDFGRLLTDQLGNDIETNKATIFSPISIMSVLSFLSLGARGKTYDELQQFLRSGTVPQGSYDSFGSELWGRDPRNNPQLFYGEFGRLLEDVQSHQQNTRNTYLRKNAYWRSTTPRLSLRRNRQNRAPMEHITKIANGIFPQVGYNLNPDYVYLLKHLYHSKLEALDFASKPVEARDFINSWVETHTFGKIRKIIDEVLTQENKLIIASALYFKGFWEDYFTSTYEDNFYPDGLQQSPIRIPTMANTGDFPYYNAPEYDCSIIGLPYQDNLTTMYIIQPNQSTRTKLKQMIHTLKAPIIEELIDKMTKTSAKIFLPKMHLQSKMYLREALFGMGVRDMFNPSVSDLSLIGGLNTDRNDIIPPPLARDDLNDYHLMNLERERKRTILSKSALFVDEIIHQVDINIHEQGTEAAAATRAILKKTGPEVFFHANSPFLFLIRHDPTKLILFYGVVNDPSS